MNSRWFGVTLIVIGLIGLFPPRSKVVNGYTSHTPAPRGFLLSQLGHYRVKPTATRYPGISRGHDAFCQIDVGRMLCEILLVSSLFGAVMVLSSVIRVDIEDYSG